MCYAVVARLVHLYALIHAGVGMGLCSGPCMTIHVLVYMLIHGVRMRTGIHMWSVVMPSSTSTLGHVWRPAVGKSALLQQGVRKVAR